MARSLAFRLLKFPPFQVEFLFRHLLNETPEFIQLQSNKLHSLIYNFSNEISLTFSFLSSIRVLIAKYYHMKLRSRAYSITY